MGPKEGPVCWSGVGNDTQTNLFASKNLLMKENGDEQDKKHCQPKERECSEKKGVCNVTVDEPKALLD